MKFKELAGIVTLAGIVGCATTTTGIHLPFQGTIDKTKTYDVIFFDKDGNGRNEYCELYSGGVPLYRIDFDREMTKEEITIYFGKQKIKIRAVGEVRE